MKQDIEVKVTYTNEMTDPEGGPYLVTIEDAYGKSRHKVTTKTIRRAGSFKAAVEKLMTNRYNKITTKQGEQK